MKNIIYLFFCLLLVVACMESKQTYKSLSTPDFVELIKDSTVQRLDVRTLEEYNEGHIDLSYFADFGDSLFISKLNLVLDKSKPVAVYCRTGRRSKKASEALVKEGYTVYELDRGITGWKESNLPVVE